MRIFYESLKTKDNFKINVLRIKPVQSTSITFMCHDLTGHKGGNTLTDSFLVELAQNLAKHDSHVVMFDFRGHGTSSGQTTDAFPSANLKDLEAVFNHYNDNKLCLNFFGFGYGASVILQFIYKNKIKNAKTALWSPFINNVDGLIENKSSVLGKVIFESLKSGSLEKDGQCLLFNNFILNRTFVEECYSADYDSIIKYSAPHTYILQPTKSNIVDAELNKSYANKLKIKFDEIEASHDLHEKLDNAISKTQSFLFN